MPRSWVEAAGSHQLIFMAAASRATRGELGQCPRCQERALRCYFHVFQPERRQGALWLWCGACSTFTHLPRVQVNAPMPDPFESLSPSEFAALETSAAEPLLDRLDRLWSEGTLFQPGAENGLPPSVLARHPELVAVGEALEEVRAGSPVGALCTKCGRRLVTEDIPVTGTLVVRCPEGHTSFRARRR